MMPLQLSTSNGSNYCAHCGMQIPSGYPILIINTGVESRVVYVEHLLHWLNEHEPPAYMEWFRPKKQLIYSDDPPEHGVMSSERSEDCRL